MSTHIRQQQQISITAMYKVRINTLTFVRNTFLTIAKVLEQPLSHQ